MIADPIQETGLMSSGMAYYGGNTIICQASVYYQNGVNRGVFVLPAY